MVGVDGCRGGWLVARAVAEPFGLVGVTVHPDLAEVIADVSARRTRLVAVDMPIGLPDRGRRACDDQARAALGPRRASVFPAPVRAALGAQDHADAVRRSRAVDGRGLSVQTWGLIPRIAELDERLAAAPVWVRSRVVESHPELALATLAGAPMRHPKRTVAGRRERLAVLRRWASRAWTQPSAVPRGAAADDVLDAIALAVRAAQWLGDGPPPVELGDGSLDARGHPMRIWG